MEQEVRNTDAEVVQTTAVDTERLFMNRVYNWMTGGLGISALVAWWVSGQMMVKGSLFSNPTVFFALLILEFGIVLVLSLAAAKLSSVAAGVCFIIYSLLNGATLAPIFHVYTGSSILAAFTTCAGTFAVTSLYGYLTKKKLDSVGSLCMMALIGIIIATIVNIFLKSTGLEIAITYIGVAVFVGLTAWDTQKLRQLAEGTSVSDINKEHMKKSAVIGALALYLDFINLFLMLLRLFGRRD